MSGPENGAPPRVSRRALGLGGSGRQSPRAALALLTCVAMATPIGTARAQWGIAWLGDDDAPRLTPELEAALVVDFVAASVAYPRHPADIDGGDARQEGASVVIRAQVRMFDAIGFEIDVPFAVELRHVIATSDDPTRVPPPPSARPLMGAPTVVASWAPAATVGDARFRGRVGIGMAIPHQGFGCHYTEFTWGCGDPTLARTGWDAHLFRPSDGAFIVPLAIELRMAPGLYAAIESTLAVSLARFARVGAEVQLAAEIGWEPERTMRLSVRASGVGAIDDRLPGAIVLDGSYDGDDLVFAVQPRFSFGVGSYLGAFAVTLPIDGFYGLERRYSVATVGWGASATLGGRF